MFLCHVTLPMGGPRFVCVCLPSGWQHGRVATKTQVPFGGGKKMMGMGYKKLTNKHKR